MRFLFSNHYWQTDEDGYMGKADYEKYGAVVRRYKDSKGKWDKAWFIDFLHARDMIQWMRDHKLLGAMVEVSHIKFTPSRPEQYFIFNPFHECE